MRTGAVAALSAILATTFWAACGGPLPEEGGGPFVVHEWGTFTALQGADGALTEGIEHETERLPDFVYSRTESEPSPFRIFGDTSYREVFPTGALAPLPGAAERERDARCRIRHPECYGPEGRRSFCGKMETPVIYFHGGAGRHVRVHVDYPDGLLTQWFPRESAATPAFVAGATLAFDDTVHSSLDWEVDLLPPALAPAGLLPVDDGKPWELAREVDADWVRSGSESEHYLFYRGLDHGAMNGGLSVQTLGGGLALVRNQLSAEIPAAFLVDMDETTGRFASLGALAPGQVANPTLLLQAVASPREETVAALGQAVRSALIAQGLFPDEAEAMVRTWSSTWFAAEGTRVIYLLPRERVDALLPLTIEPKPDALVRVLVGRLEYLTPERASAIEADLEAVARGDAPAAQARLARLGRFLEPAVRSVMRQDSDLPEVQAGGARVLAAFGTP